MVPTRKAPGAVGESCDRRGLDIAGESAAENAPLSISKHIQSLLVPSDDPPNHLDRQPQIIARPAQSPQLFPP